MKLYEIDQQIEHLLDYIWQVAEETDGEIPDNLGAMLDELELERQTKLCNIGRLYKNLSAEADAIREEEKRLAVRRRALDRKADWLKQYAATSLKPGEKLSDAAVAYGWRKSTAVEVLDETAVPDQFFAIERKVMVSLIKDELKAGREVPGAVMVERMNIQVK